jgi:hypothetical protein
MGAVTKGSKFAENQRLGMSNQLTSALSDVNWVSVVLGTAVLGYELYNMYATSESSGSRSNAGSEKDDGDERAEDEYEEVLQEAKVQETVIEFEWRLERITQEDLDALFQDLLVE